MSYRWAIQALAFVGCIYFFLKIWELSKIIVAGAETPNLIFMILYILAFMFCFFCLALTSYLKQKNNATLQNPILFFERLIELFGLSGLPDKKES